MTPEEGSEVSDVKPRTAAGVTLCGPDEAPHWHAFGPEHDGTTYYTEDDAIAAVVDAERSARPAPADGLDVESPGSKFLAEAATEMRRRFDHGARKFGRYSWRDDPYEDEDNLERLRRAVDHLEAARANSDDPAEWQKRAADVANQAFMFADPERYRPDAIRAALGARLEAER